MGLTIHWELEFKGTQEQVKEKLAEVLNRSRQLQFQYTDVDIKELDYSKNWNDDEENRKQAKSDNEDLKESYRWLKIQLGPRDKKEKRQDGTYWVRDEDFHKYKGLAVHLWSGAGCEPTNIGLITKDGENWQGAGFTKTQYSEHFVKCHLQVICILKVCQSLGILKEVHDEGEYWETGDINKLADNINQSTAFIKNFAKILKDIYSPDKIEAPITTSKNYVNVKRAKRYDNSNQD